MRERGGKTYRPWEPERYRQDAHSPAAKLPEGDLVFFLLDTVPQLELSRLVVYLSPAANPAGPAWSRSRDINRTVLTSPIEFPSPPPSRCPRP
jgi:hypothetical protein